MAVRPGKLVAVINGHEYSFPHCDHRVLHSPGTCRYCDAYPDRQAGRKAALICFTGEDPKLREGGPWIGCPSDTLRGLAGAHVWPGNRPAP